MFNVTLYAKGARPTGLRKRLSAWLRREYKEAEVVRVERKRQAGSRAERFDIAQQKLGDAKNEADELRDELQSWFDNLPEPFQNGLKGDELQQAIDALQEFIDACEEAESIGVDFPGMY